MPGIESAAHYVSASSAADVGGDFYDLLDLPDGSVGIAVGDVVGHDVAAAAAMGHLRGVLRAVVWDAEDADPGAVLPGSTGWSRGCGWPRSRPWSTSGPCGRPPTGAPWRRAHRQRRTPADPAARTRRARSGSSTR